MKQPLIFATNNHHKVIEIRNAIDPSFQIASLSEAGIDLDIPEPYNTLEENASEKSRVIHELTGQNCFSEDTGLEVKALNNEPGVKSARYAGEGRDFGQNIEKLLANLEGVENREAQFRSVISLIWEEKEYLFEGVCKGKIVSDRRGIEGFGYDPVFIPEGETRTFAEMSLEEKNKYSHRRKAMDKLVAFFNEMV